MGKSSKYECNRKYKICCKNLEISRDMIRKFNQSMYVYKENAQKGDETGSETVDISEIMVRGFFDGI
jgi:hypothetical protein